MSYLVFNIVLFLLISLTILSLYLTYKVENLEEKMTKLKRKIKNYKFSLIESERKISDRNKILEYQEEKITKLQNKINEYEKFITSNNYGSVDIQIRKLKELARPDNQN